MKQENEKKLLLAKQREEINNKNDRIKELEKNEKKIAAEREKFESQMK